MNWKLLFLLLFHIPIVWALESPENKVIVALCEQALHHPDFLEKIEGETVVCLLNPEEKEQYGAREGTMLLLLDPRGREFARLGALPLEAGEYGEKVHRLIADFEEICHTLEHPNGPFDEERWKHLFEKATALSATCYRDVILNQGVKREKGSFFHLQKYAALLQKHKAKDPKVIAFKKKLLQRKSASFEDLPFAIAAVEFQRKAKGKNYPKKALKPLFQYLRLKEKKNEWRAEWMIAEHLFSKNDLSGARTHIEAAYRKAPPEFKEELRQATEWLRKHLPEANAEK